MTNLVQFPLFYLSTELGSGCQETQNIIFMYYARIILYEAASEFLQM